MACRMKIKTVSCMTAQNNQRIALNENESDLYFRIENIKGTFSGTLCIGSGGFFCETPIYFNKKLISTFLSNLKSMYSSLAGNASIQEDYEETFVNLEIDSQGHVIVSGQASVLSEHSNTLNFTFATDQTELPYLIETTQTYLNHQNMS